MRVSREKFAENREKILDVAGVLFRENGFDGIGVAEIMKGAGLTHGGFYGHFDSKEDLALEVGRNLVARVELRWREIIAGAPERPLEALLEHYLSRRNVDDRGVSCVFASMMQEVSRQRGPMRSAFAEGLQSLVGLLQDIVPGDTADERRANAFSTLSAMMGAVILARVAEDGAVVDAFLDTTRERLWPRRE